MSEAAGVNGLSLAPMRALRYTVDGVRLGRLLCPPYDVIDAAERSRLLAQDPDNAVQIILPLAPPGSAPPSTDQARGVAPEQAPDQATNDQATDDGPRATDPAYVLAADTLTRWAREGVVAVDAGPALYVYEMSTARSGAEPASVTRGLVGAVELRDPADGVILPHENTMAGPVADRLALMEATDANLEPIYLVYDGGGAASRAVAGVRPPADDPAAGTPSGGGSGDGTRAGADDPEAAEPPQFLISATTPDGTVHRLWAITDEDTLRAIAADLGTRHALIADGHHRYATYLRLAERRREIGVPGPWDRGLALLVDSSAYGPQVHAIHRVIPDLELDRAATLAGRDFTVESSADPDHALELISTGSPAGYGHGFAVVLTDGRRSVIVSAPSAEILASTRRDDEPEALLDLDVSVLHRILIERTWNLIDNEETVLYAHSRAEAVSEAVARGGIAVLLRPTPVEAVAAVAAAGARMPRKSTLFTPKPASGLLMRRFVDQPAERQG